MLSLNGQLPYINIIIERAAPIFYVTIEKGSSNMKMLSWKRVAPICKCYHGKGQLQYVNVIMERGQLQYVNAIMEKGNSTM